MIAALQKRPFARPLFIWIAGILLQSSFPVHLSVGIALAVPLLCLLFSFAGKKSVSYTRQWLWGVVFSFLLLSLSVLVAGYAEKGTAQSHPPSMLQQWASATQIRLASEYETLDIAGREKSVLATLTLGYRQAMRKDVRRQFSVTGVAHILAVSGFHVAVVCSMLSLVLFLIPNYGVGHFARYLLMILLLWMYVWITGLAASSVRAGLMLSLYLTGKLLGRRGDSYNTLAAAAFCMLAYNPLYLYDIGFQLSFTAVWFILFLQPRFASLIDVRNPLIAKIWNTVTVTVAAQAGTLFLCLYYFGYVSTVFLLSNLPVALISSLLIPSALLWLLLPAALPGYTLLQSMVEALTHWLFTLVERFSLLPGSAVSIRFDLPEMLWCYAILFIFLLYHKERKPRILLFGLCVLLMGLLLKIA